jgi:hypothetical protein
MQTSILAADTHTHQIFCILVMYMSTFVFGTLLSEVEAAVEAARSYVRAKGRVKQQIQQFLQVCAWMSCCLGAIFVNICPLLFLFTLLA